MKALLAHPGTQYSHRLAAQLVRRDVLSEFWTGFAMAEGEWSTKALSYLPESWRRKFSNRIIQGVPASCLRTIPTVEFKALYQLRRGRSPQEVFHERNRIFQERIPDASIQKASVSIGFDTSSWILADRAVTSGKAFILDQSIAHPLVKESALKRVADRFPDWEEEIERRLPSLLDCENREHDLASRIVVASTYTRQTLLSRGIPSERIIVNPYGVDPNLFHPPERSRAIRPLRFLFLGSITARKGVPLLAEAWRSLALKEAELWLVGPVTPRERRLIPELPGLRIMGKHPHRDLPNLLGQCDVLVFPSYCEGFGQVLLEALASGLPIVTTEATAGPDLIQNGIEGFLIPSGELDALIQAMRFFVDHREKIDGMSKAARCRAEMFSWESYGDRWLKILEDLH